MCIRDRPGERDRAVQARRRREEQDPDVRRAVHVLRAMRRRLSGRRVGDDRGVPPRRHRSLLGEPDRRVVAGIRISARTASHRRAPLGARLLFGARLSDYELFRPVERTTSPFASNSRLNRLKDRRWEPLKMAYGILSCAL